MQMSLRSIFYASLISIVITAANAMALELSGAGATFPLPLYSAMNYKYSQNHKIQVNYQGIGSGGGIKQIENQTVDYAGTDSYLTDKKMAELSRPLLHVPICSGGVSLIFNIPGLAALNLTPDVLADIFRGKIDMWNHPRIKAINPKAALPALKIHPVRRAEGSGTTHIFTYYLSQVSPSWNKEIGHDTVVSWPKGLAGKGNAGVATLVKQLPGAIGYVASVYSAQNKMNVALIKNKSGKYIAPTLSSISAASKGITSKDSRVMLTNTEAANGYPISGYTWLLLYQEQSYGGRSIEQARELVKFMSWMVNEGQTLVAPLDFVPLTPETMKLARTILEKVTFKGEPLTTLP